MPGPFSGSGWVRRPDAGTVKIYSKKDNEALKMEVLKELGYL